MAKVSPLKKLTPAQVGFEPTKINWSAQKEPVFVYRIAGLAKSLRPYTAPNGEKAYGLRGAFKIIAFDKKEYTSGVFYPPGYIQEMIEPLISDDDDFEGVKIAMDIFAKKSTNIRAGSSPYEYVAELHTEAESLDVIAELEASMPALPFATSALQLTAPKGKKGK